MRAESASFVRAASRVACVCVRAEKAGGGHTCIPKTVWFYNGVCVCMCVCMCVCVCVCVCVLVGGSRVVRLLQRINTQGSWCETLQLILV